MATAEVCGLFAPLVHVTPTVEGEAVGGVNRWTAIMDQFRSAQSLLNACHPRRVLTAGGDCAVDIAVIDYLHRVYSDLTVIWVDAHLDSNTPDTSPSGDFHGMPVAAIMGAAPADMQPRLGRPLSPTQFFYVSAHVGDAGEWAFQRDNGLRWWEMGQPLSGPVHIHFDLDVLDPAEFPYLAYLDGTMAMETGLDIVRDIASKGDVVGLTITEFAPADVHQVASGSQYIRKLCEAAGA